MINAEVILEYNLWSKKLKKPKIYLNEKLGKISKFLPYKKKIQMFTILLTNNNKIKNLNFKFRKKNKKTDVLSFPFWNIKEIKKNKDKKLYLGDIAISYQYVKSRSKFTNFNFEFDKMWLHGYLHLLGYDHKKNKDYYRMKKIEDKLLKYLQKTN